MGKVSILHFPNLEAVCCIAFSSINSKQPATHQEFPPKIKYPDWIYMLNFIACFGPLPLIPTLDPQRSEWRTNYNFKGHKSLSKFLPSLQVKGLRDKVDHDQVPVHPQNIKGGQMWGNRRMVKVGLNLREMKPCKCWWQNSEQHACSLVLSFSGREASQKMIFLPWRLFRPMTRSPGPPKSDERTNQRIDTTSKGLTTLVMDGASNSSGVVGKGQPAETYLSSRS